MTNCLSAEKAAREFADRLAARNGETFTKQFAEQGIALTWNQPRESWYEFIAKELETYRADIIERSCGQAVTDVSSPEFYAERGQQCPTCGYFKDMESSCSDSFHIQRACGETAWDWPNCDYTSKPCLDNEQLCRCGTCQLFANVLRNRLLPSPPTAEEK